MHRGVRMSKRRAARKQPPANVQAPDRRLHPVSWKWYLGVAVAVVMAFTATFVIVAAVYRPTRPPEMVWVPGGEFTMGTDSDLGWARSEEHTAEMQSPVH